MRNIRQLSALLAKKAAEELNENPSDVQFYLDALKQWLLKQRHLKARIQDQFLVTFLRAGKFSLEAAKRKIDNFYTYRGFLPEAFWDRDIENPKLNEVLKMGIFVHLPQPLAEDGPRVIMLRFGNIDFHRCTVMDVVKVCIMMLDICLYDDDNAIVAGYVLILDLDKVTSFHLLHFDPMFIRKLTIMANKAIPSRMKGFHMINMTPTFEKCFNMVKGVISEKLRNRFYFHGNKLEKLYEYVPKHCLPIEYGGKCDTVADIIDHWEMKLKKHKDFFSEEEQYGCDDKLREGKSISPDSLFGIEGSFRKLDID